MNLSEFKLSDDGRHLVWEGEVKAFFFSSPSPPDPVVSLILTPPGGTATLGSVQPVSDEVLTGYATGPGWRSLLEPYYDDMLRKIDTEMICGPSKKDPSVGTEQPYTIDSLFEMKNRPYQYGGYDKIQRAQESIQAMGEQAMSWVGANPGIPRIKLPNAPKEATVSTPFRYREAADKTFKSVKVTKDNVRELAVYVGEKLDTEVIAGSESFGVGPFSPMSTTPVVEFPVGTHIVEGWDYERGVPTFRKATLEERETYDLR